MKPPFLLVIITFLFQASWAQEKKDVSTPPKEVQKAEPELYIESYVVPPTFLSTGGLDNPDPFSTEKGSERAIRTTAQSILEEAGISFLKGASATYSPAGSLLTVINTEAQLELVDYFTGVTGCGGVSRQITVILEYIETDSSRFQDWMFENRIETDGTPLRKDAQKWVKEGNATIIETVIVNSRSGQRAKTASVREIIYPTEYDPVEIPNEVTLSGKDSVSPMNAVTGTAFESRNVGTTLEVDPVLGGDLLTIDLNLAPEIVQLKEKFIWVKGVESDPSIVWMPVFHKLKITTQTTSLTGRYSFLGAAPPLKASDPNRKKPIIMVFVRGDIVEPPLVLSRKKYRVRAK